MNSMVRYNKDGEWKPICFSGNPDAIQKRIMSETQDDRVRGSLFYIRTTGFKVIEFVIKGDVVLPSDTIQLPNGVRLFPVSEQEEPTDPAGRDWISERHIYDGTISVNGDDVPSVKAALDTISWTVGLLGYIFQTRFHWTIKYRMSNNGSGDALVGATHLEFLDRIAAVEYEERDRVRLQSGLDWLAQAKRMDSPFSRFLATWIAIEGLASAIYDGKLFPDFGIERGDKEYTIRQRIRQAISFAVGKIREIRPANRLSAADKVKRVLTSVFGEDRKMVDRVFMEKGTAGYNLAKVRHNITHGEFVEWDHVHLSTVWSALPNLEDIANELVVRLLLRLSPKDQIPKLSREYRIVFSTVDPRTTLVCSDLRVLAGKDWRIRPEWIN